VGRIGGICAPMASEYIKNPSVILIVGSLVSAVILSFTKNVKTSFNQGKDNQINEVEEKNTNLSQYFEKYSNDLSNVSLLSDKDQSTYINENYRKNT